MSYEQAWVTAALAVPGVSLRAGAATHPGRSRALNEDGWLAQSPVFVVADGMGGHAAGDEASAAVIRNFARLASVLGEIGPHEIQASIEASRTEIASLDVGEGRSPGSTVVAATVVSQGDRAYWLIANVGDSRAYAFVDGMLEQLSRDHSVVQELIEAGQLAPEDVESHPERHVITRALGALANSPADYTLIPLTNGSRILLCSDGVSTEVPLDTMREVLASDQPAQLVAEELVNQAVMHGGHDNATAVVVDVRIEGAARVDVDTSAGSRALVDTVPGGVSA